MEGNDAGSSKSSFWLCYGRARRRTYWLFALVTGLTALTAVVIACWPIFCELANGGMDDLSSVLCRHGYGLLVASAICIVALFLMLVVAVRRLHDRNMSGWWLTVFLASLLIPDVGFVLCIVQFVIMGCLEGTPGKNRYGANPKEGA